MEPESARSRARIGLVIGVASTVARATRPGRGRPEWSPCRPGVAREPRAPAARERSTSSASSVAGCSPRAWARSSTSRRKPCGVWTARSADPVRASPRRSRTSSTCLTVSTTGSAGHHCWGTGGHRRDHRREQRRRGERRGRRRGPARSRRPGAGRQARPPRSRAARRRRRPHEPATPRMTRSPLARARVEVSRAARRRPPRPCRSSRRQHATDQPSSDRPSSSTNALGTPPP